MIASRRLASLAVLTAVLWFLGVRADCLVGGSGGGLAARAGDSDGSAAISLQAASDIVINELHVDPDVKTELVEFVELYNAGTLAVDLSGWQFDGGVFLHLPRPGRGCRRDAT